MTPTATTNSSQLTRQEINQKQKEFIFPSVTTYYSDPVPMDHALMQHVWDVDGKKYLDFFGGIVTISVGHCNPRVISRTKADRKSTRLNSSHVAISYAVFCLKK